MYKFKTRLLEAIAKAIMVCNHKLATLELLNETVYEKFFSNNAKDVYDALYRKQLLLSMQQSVMECADDAAVDAFVKQEKKLYTSRIVTENIQPTTTNEMVNIKLRIEFDVKRSILAYLNTLNRTYEYTKD